MLTIGQFIQHKREFLGLKKSELSSLLGVGDDTRLSWENDKSKPSGINIDKLLEILRLTKDEAKTYFGYEHRKHMLSE
jgi:DNA-binding transcriptional regulator YiaG